MADSEARRWLQRVGLRSLLPAEGLAGLAAALQSGTAQVVVADVDWPRFYAVMQARRRQPLLSALASEARPSPAPALTTPLTERLKLSPTGRRVPLLAEHICQRTAELLGVDREHIQPEQKFFDLGADSLMAVELANRLNADLGVSVPGSLVLDHPTLADTAEHLVTAVLQLPAAEDAAQPAQPATLPAEPADNFGVASGPIAVVGMAARVPGATTVEEFWRLLRDRADAIRVVPSERWDVDAFYDPDPNAVGKVYTRAGGFVEGVDRFDANLFNISPREAASMDPQQRLLLETTWTALERALIPCHSLHGQRVGVYVGVGPNEYGALLAAAGDEMIDAYYATGNAANVIAGRLAYVLGLQGPALAIDTACSSSLVAVHQACQSLRGGECDLALAGGVNMLLTPQSTIAACRARMLSPEGRCKTFDAAADGYVRGEGCGVVVLKRLAEAERDKDPILAVIRGSAVNQDGASGGLTVPNGQAQQQVIAAALRRAGVQPAEVAYLECHGTGTSLGDPIEVQAAAAALGAGREPGRPLLLGSVKANLGHLEAAAGIVGLMKVILSLNEGVIPGQVHFHQPNPHIAWERLAVRVAAQTTPWPEGRRLAGVSSFGFSGTNAHVVVEGYPQQSQAVTAPQAAPPVLVWPLSARSVPALRELAGRHAQWLGEHPQADLADVCFSAGVGRSHLTERAAVLVRSHEQARAVLERLARGESCDDLIVGQRRQAARVALLCGGFRGLPAESLGWLSRSQPVFRQMLHRCEELMADQPGGQSLARLRQGATQHEEELGRDGAWAPVWYAVQVGLWELYRHWGVHAEVVLGQGVGSYAAGYAAGVLTLADGLQLAAWHGLLVAPDEWLGVQEAAELERLAATLTYQPPHRLLVSGSTGLPAEQEQALNPAYWVRQAQQPATGDQMLAAVAQTGCTVFLDLTSGSSAAALAEGLQADSSRSRRVLVTALAAAGAGRHGPDEGLARAAAQLYAAGTDLDFAALAGGQRQRLALPTYPFQRQRYWVDGAGTPAAATAGHSLLGKSEVAATGQTAYRQQLSLATHTWVGDHRVYDTAVVPGVSYAAMTIAAVGTPATLRDVMFAEPLLLLSRQQQRETELLVHPADLTGARQVKASSREGSFGDGWRQHALLKVVEPVRVGVNLAAVTVDLAAVRAASRPMDLAQLAERYAQASLTYGPMLQAVRAAWVSETVALSEIEAPPALAGQLTDEPIHPVLLDACTRLFPGWESLDAEPGIFWAPWRVTEVSLERSAPRHFYAYVDRPAVMDPARQTLCYDIELLDEQGVAFGRLDGFTLRRAPREAFLRHLQPPAGDLLYQVQWRKQPVKESGPEERRRPARWLVLGQTAAALASHLVARGHQAHHARALQEGLMAANGNGDVSLTGVVWLSGQAAAQELPDAAVADEAMSQAAAVLRLTQSLLAQRMSLPHGLVLATVRGVAVEMGDEVDPSQAVLWGLGRALQAEQPHLNVRLVDLDRADPESLAVALAGEEPELAVRDVERFTPRLVRGGGGGLAAPAGEVALGFERRGSLDQLRLTTCEVPAPGPGQVQVLVRAAGVNFRDVLNVLGAYPGDPGPLGGEMAGVVTAVGDGVTHLAVGDRTLGLAAGTFASRCNVPAELLVRLPDGLDFAAGATIPVVFCTAQAAFELAGLRAGQRVLIHAAAGGVGLAAVQLAQALGAEVHASASARKQGYLRTLGVRYVYDSRSTAFQQELSGNTGGRGVDVVLNSLTSAGFIEASLACLAAGGHFVEIGKRDIWSPEQVRAARRDVCYHVLALDDWMRHEPGRVRTLLEGLTRRLARAELQPVRRRVYPLAAAPAALRYLRQARQIGKVVLTIPHAAVRPEASYLITGGLGALGLATCAWLIGRGARHVVLTGRRTPDEAGRGRLAALEAAHGCRVDVWPADMAEPEQVEGLMARFGRDWPALAGVIHAAGVLDDGVITEQTAERFEAVFRPKVRGAWNLHRATRGMDLDFFVLYSSAAATLGSAGQSGYAAANAFLDGLAQYRQALGLPAASVGWGPWGGDGMAAKGVVQSRLSQLGLAPLAARSALAALDRLLSQGATTAVVLEADWSRVSQQITGRKPGLLAELVGATTGWRAASGARQRPAAVSSENRSQELAGCVQEELCQVMGLASRPDSEARFVDLGMDSLMAVELCNRLNTRLELEQPLAPSALFDHPSISALVAFVQPQLSKGNASLPVSISPVQKTGSGSVSPVQKTGSGSVSPVQKTGSGPLPKAERVEKDIPPPPRGSCPLSPEQERLCRLERATPGNPSLFIPFALSWSGPLDVDRLQSALDGVVVRHDSLRTAFPLEGAAAATVLDHAFLGLVLEDLSRLPSAVRREQQARRLEEAARRPFDLASPPLARVTVWKIGPEQYVLGGAFHHLIFDFWSLGVFLQDLLRGYGAGSVLPPTPACFADFVAWDRAHRPAEKQREHRAFWERRLGPEYRNPVDWPFAAPADLCPSAGRAKPSSTIGCLTRTFSPATAANLRETAVREKTSVFGVLLSRFGLLLHLTTAQERFLVVSAVPNRPLPSLHEVLGFFAAPTLAPLDVTPAARVGDLTRETFRRWLEALEHPLPFAELGALVLQQQTAPADSRQRPLQVFFGYLDRDPMPREVPPGVKLAYQGAPRGGLDFDLSFSLLEGAGGLRANIEYDASVLPPDAVHRLADRFEALLQLGPETGAALVDSLHDTLKVRRRPRLRVAATFTLDPLAAHLERWASELPDRPRVELADYNQVLQELLNPQSRMRTNRHGLNVLLIRLEDAFRDQAGDRPHLPPAEAAEQFARELLSALAEAASAGAADCCVGVCPPSTAVRDNPGLAAALDRIGNDLLMAAGQWAATIDAGPANALCPATSIDDPERDRLAHIPYTDPYYRALAGLIARRAFGATGPRFKVLVVDCDEVLWGGVLGEDGVDGVRLDEPRRALQRQLLARQATGWLLCLCSKNDEADVLRVLDERPEMLLRREHLVGWRINWQPKSANLRDLAQELNLGLDSFVFLDDNPAECAEVEANCPEVLTLCLPTAAERIATYLDDLWVFDARRATAEDVRRTELYRQNQARRDARRQTGSFQDFLERLQLEVAIAPARPEDLGRVAQLTQRTNQFNTTTVRRTQEEVARSCAEGDWVLTTRVRDRFGDYGLVGVAMGRPEGEALRLDALLLSCRVLGRTVEHRMLADLGERAVHAGLAWVVVPVRATPRNQPVRDFLEGWQRRIADSVRTAEGFRFPAAALRALDWRVEQAESDGSDPERMESAPAAHEIASWTERRRLSAFLERARTRQADKASAAAAQAGDSGRSEQKSAEQEMRELWAEVLRVAPAEVAGDFFADLNGSSLQAVELVSTAKRRLGLPLALEAFFEAPTLEAMTGRLRLHRAGEGAPQAAAIDLRAEAVLDANVRPRREAATRGEAAPVLLTGATGFLGAYLLRHLLDRTRGVFCLVRAESETAAWKRLERNLKQYSLWNESDRGRLRVLPGDFGLPGLGLTPEVYQRLAKEVATVYHNGAQVDFLAPYRTLKPANVVGTEEVLRFACAGRIKPVHFVSTTAIHLTRVAGCSDTIPEANLTEDAPAPAGGYAQSKWVAEHLVRQAGQRGLPVAIYRPGGIGPADNHPSAPLDLSDFATTVMVTCLDMGCFPDVNGPIDYAPVNYVSAALVELSMRPESLGAVFHLTNPGLIDVYDFAALVRQAGSPLDLVPYADWVDRLTRYAAGSPNRYLKTLLPLFTEPLAGLGVSFFEKTLDRPVFDTRHCVRGLEGGNVRCAPIDLEWVRRQLRLVRGVVFA